nr:uncharacterized protein LOC104099745 [Nicotiana tomentosiformis]
MNISKDIVLVDDPNVVAATGTHTPTLHISDPDLAKMIKDSQKAMLMHTIPKGKVPLVTLNASVHEVPSQSMESYGERAVDSGQQLLSTGNNQQANAGGSTTGGIDQ